MGRRCGSSSSVTARAPGSSASGGDHGKGRSVTVRILLQTTIPYTEDDWSIERFSLLRDFLATVRTDAGEDVAVTARNRARAGGDDPILSQLDTSEFDELWLFAVDNGDGLSAGDCRGISAFARRGGGLL